MRKGSGLTFIEQAVALAPEFKTVVYEKEKHHRFYDFFFEISTNPA